MKLNIGNLYVKDVQLAQRDAFEDGILYINKDAAVAYLKDCDEHITDLDIVIARPGDDTRIVPVIETIEPAAVWTAAASSPESPMTWSLRETAS